MAWAADTSVAIAVMDGAHAAHDVCVALARARRPALAGHALFETYSVLTRLRGRLSIDSATAVAALAITFPERIWMTAPQHEALLRRCGPTGIAGGAVYDALVAEAARVYDHALLTRDRRAARTYDSIGVDYELVEDD